MVGEGVLHECLRHPGVERVLVIGRQACGVRHEKLTEIVHAPMGDWSSLREQLADYDACFFCLGTTSVGMSEADYSEITYDLTINAAELLAELNPDMAFCYVSAAGADATERGRSMWARVKGRTENALQRLPFRAVYLFRPAYVHPTPGLQRAHRYYKTISWMYPILRKLMPRYTITLREIGLAMIQTAMHGSGRRIVESKDMAELAREA